MIDEYFEKDKYYKKKYGKKTFLLYQVGSFEVYGIKMIIGMENIESYAEICGLAVASKSICVGGTSGVRQILSWRDFVTTFLINILKKFSRMDILLLFMFKKRKTFYCSL